VRVWSEFVWFRTGANKSGRSEECEDTGRDDARERRGTCPVLKQCLELGNRAAVGMSRHVCPATRPL